MNIQGNNFRIEGMKPYNQLLIIENREGSTVRVDNTHDAILLVKTIQKWLELQDPFQQIDLTSVSLYSLTNNSQSAVFEVGSVIVELDLVNGEWGLSDAYTLDGGYTPMSLQPYQKYLPTMIQKINEFNS